MGGGGSSPDRGSPLTSLSLFAVCICALLYIYIYIYTCTYVQRSSVIYFFNTANILYGVMLLFYAVIY